MRPTQLWIALLCLLSPALTSNAPAVEIHVPADQSTIQAAIDVASAGDEVVVAPGTYFETIDFLGKAIEVRSSGGAAMTTLNGSGISSSIVTFDSGEGPGSVLNGFTLTQGQGTVLSGFTRLGLAIRIAGASPVIRNCIASGNGLAVVTDGGAIHCSNSSALIEDCQFVDNNASAAGAIYIGDASTVRIERCSFENCTTQGLPGFNAGAIASIQDSTTTVADCRFEACSSAPGGSGGAIFASSGSLGGPPNLIVVNSLFVGNSANVGGAIFNSSGRAGVTNCTFTENTAETNGAALSAESVTVTNSILWGNGPNPIASSPWELTYCNVEGGFTGTGNIDVDPQFTATYALAATSPCIDAGTNAADLNPVTPAVEPLPTTDLAQLPRFQDVPTVPDTGAGSAPIVDLGCYEHPGAPSPILFIRGDVNADGTINIADPILITNWLFAAGPDPSCMDAADSNDDATVNIGDAITTLNYLFAAGPIPQPNPNCGADPTPDTLTCNDTSCP